MSETEVFIILDRHTEQQLAQLKKQDHRIEHLMRVLIFEGRAHAEEVHTFMVDTTQALTDLQTAATAILAKVANPPVPVDVTPDAQVQTLVDGVNAVTAELNAAP